ncbi:GNAT family N-acetyltransferase [Streptomyces iconiensis]|uniref:GNAT family N-acetyltransferase n=1 Tax=Streptomyces iconiensis TaxID=1384038 RepID=A0ABT7A0P3_9ACTN|nr:GNAT family N-acetyltransferase [Streptomyces iconiensis]MDJ1134890.1 GNAT family N-acetyltransferase [Streptomyces iconiensis]
MAEVFVRRLTRWQADQQREAIADMYVETYRRAQGEEYHDRQEFLRRFSEDVQRPGFDMVVANTTGPAGCGYGFRLDRGGDWWHDFLGARSRDAEELTASGKVFAVAELMVLPSVRRRHIATRVMEQLMARLDAELVTARVEPANVPARSALQSWGWARLGDARTSPQTPVFEVWSKPARLPL